MKNLVLFWQGVLKDKLQAIYLQRKVSVTSAQESLATYDSLTGRLRDDNYLRVSGARVAREWLKVAATLLLLFIVGIGNVWATPTSGSLSFGSASGHVGITSSTTSLTDTNSKSWSFSQTQGGTDYFNTTTNDVQVGSNNSPLTSMSFSVTFASSIKVTAFSASFTGSSKKANQSVSLKVGTTEVASATISGASNVNPSYSNATGTTGTTLSVTLSGTAGGVKCISISYTYETISSKTLVILELL